MNAFHDQCIQLRNEDYTLSEIVKITGRSKTSVHYHIKNMPLSERRRKEWREKSAARIIAIAEDRKGKSLLGRHPKQFDKWSRELVGLVAHLTFDGWISHAGCYYANRNESLILHVSDLMRDVYDFPPKTRLNAKTGVFHLCYFNVELADYLRLKREELFLTVCRMERLLKREFLKAFFDDEGCMDFRPSDKIRRVRGYQKNIGILHLINSLLQDFEIESHVKQPNEIVIAGKIDLQKFQKEINFSPGVRINGNRPNSIWKKHLEKRFLLESAIVSFKPAGSNGVHRAR